MTVETLADRPIDFQNQILELIEMINYYISEAEESNDQKLQLARGLFMLMHLEQLKDADWSHVAFQIVSAINILYKAADIKPLDPTH